MTKRLIIALLAAASLAFMVESPESRREVERQQQAWRARIENAYDLRALHDFLKAQINAIPMVEGVALGQAKMTRKWKPSGSAYVCGDWLFVVPDPDSAEFTLTWIYDTTRNAEGTDIQKSVTLHCRRDTRSSFTLVRATRDDDEIIHLTP